ncbi:MAG TPA: histidinol-phosphate transaminase [Gemmatimonadales bacterium]|nr:histidinol-phosphate transaminase [Gemmatimonadales bacterium]
MSGSTNPPTASTPHDSLERVARPAVVLPHAADGLSLIKPSVRGLPGYTLAALPAVRKLNQNESPFDFPPELKREVLEAAADKAWQRYPDFAPADVLALLAEHFGWLPDGVLVGNGSNELIGSILSVTLRPGDALVAPSPTFSLYRLLTGVFGGRYVPVSLDEHFAFDVDGLIATAQDNGARVIVINSPNNPTGSALPEGAIERILSETGALVVCDEAYQDFGGPSALPLLSRSSRLVVLRTFSKAWGLAGLRLGLALAHPAVAREIGKGKLPYNVNVITLAAARTALRHAPVLATRTRQLIETRDRFIERLRLVPGLIVYPTAANFVLIRTSRVPAKELFHRLRDGYGILVRDVSDSAQLAECLRISIGTPDDMDAVIDALEQVLGELPGDSAADKRGQTRMQP